MMKHVEEKKRESSQVCIAISLADLSVWCYECDEYIVHPKLDRAYRELHWGKFGVNAPASLHSFSFEMQEESPNAGQDKAGPSTAL